jgi:transcriptional regulator with XRE-family HTH domain
MSEKLETMNENVKPISLVKKGRFKNTAEMIRGLATDEKQADLSIHEMNQRCVIDFLMALRSSRGFSQTDLAAKMECTQSRISKLENGKDDDLRIGEFRDYVRALGMDLSFLLTKNGENIVGQVKQHVFAIRDLLMALGKMAGDDQVMADGMKETSGCQVSQFSVMKQSSARKFTEN